MLILRLGLFFAPALCRSLFHHRFLIESEQSAAADEASSGPVDTEYLFDKFIENMEKGNK